MRQLLNSDLELFVESDFIYLPLLFDPEIEKEIQTIFPPENQIENSAQPDLKTIIKIKDKYFVKALNLHSLLKNYEEINAYSYKHLRNACLQKYHLTREVDSIFFGETLNTILFQVMPYFVRKNRGLQRKNLSDEEILDFVDEKIHIPGRYYKEAETFGDLQPLQAILKGLEDEKPIYKPPVNGLFTGRKLRKWLHETVHANVLASEYKRIAETLKAREQFSQTKPKHIAIFLYLADTGSLEIDGFGFTRKNGYKGEYFVYKRVGEFVLKDYYARSYLFPACRVAVSTYTPFRPFIMEKYKHPFLFRHKSGQEICMQHFAPPNEFTAENAIRIIEEGLTALRYGYDARRRNGYHSLDRTWVHIPTIDFEDYRI